MTRFGVFSRPVFFCTLLVLALWAVTGGGLTIIANAPNPAGSPC